MMDNRKACEEMLDAQLEELNARIGLFRPRAGENALHGSGEDIKGGADGARAEGQTSFHSTASKFK